MLSFILLLLFLSAKSTPEIIGYWEGYDEYNVYPYPIDQISVNVSIIQIAFFAPAVPKGPSPESTFWEFGISTATYMPESIFRGIRNLQNRTNPPKILISIMDTPETFWNTVNIDIFSYNLMTLIEEWNLDGINIDAESGMPSDDYIETFISLIKSLRSYIGPDKLLTYTTYGQSLYDSEILNATHQYIDMLETMSYWDDIDETIDTFNWYANVMNDPTKIVIGVGVNITDPSTIKGVGNWLMDNGYNKMMLWSVTQDVQEITGIPNNSWINLIYESLSG